MNCFSKYYIVILSYNSTYRFLNTERFTAIDLSTLVHTYPNGFSLRTEEERFYGYSDFETIFHPCIPYALPFSIHINCKGLVLFISRNFFEGL